MRLLAASILVIGLSSGCVDASANRAPTESAAVPPVVSATAIHEVTLPAGTRLPIIMDTTVGSDISRVEQPVRAHISRAIVLDGRTVIPQGSQLNGVVTDATRSGRVKGRAHVAVRFQTLVPRGRDERYAINTGSIARSAAATKKKDALEIAGPAAGGALVGAIVGGKKGAAVGTAVGGGAGTAVVLSTRGKEVRLSRGAVITLRLREPLTLRTDS
jgi:hypothetical protein